jgi:hypothetical protein
MAIRNNNISSRKIYIGTNTEIVPNDGDALISGNVGIGTTSPGAKLEVNGQTVINSTGLTEGFQWFNDTNEIFSLEDTSGAGELLLLSSNSVKVKLNANGNSYFNGGNVGINNTSPVNGKLVVTSTEEDLLNTVRIQHTRSNSNFGSKALEIDMNLSGADTTTADRTNRGIYVDLDSSADGDAANEHRIRGIESDVRFTGFSDIVRAGQFYAESNNITEKTAQLVGVYGQAVHDAGNAAGGVSNMIGAYGYSSIQDLGDVDNAFGVYGLVDIGDNRGNADVGVTKAVEGEISINKASTISYGTMIGISSIIDNNEGSVPNFGNQYLFKGDYQGTRGNNAWGIYTEGDKNYFEGNVGIGTTSPLNPLSIESSSSPLIKIRNTTNGSGAAIEFNDNGTSATTQNGRISYYHSDSQSQGGGSSFWLTGQDDQTLVLANNGRVVVQKSGSASEVGYGFYDDVNTGMYRVSADALGFSTGGTRRLDMNSSGVRIGTGSRVTTILDQDNMSSNSNTALATQQSIKAYVDNEIAGVPQGTVTGSGVNQRLAFWSGTSSLSSDDELTWDGVNLNIGTYAGTGDCELRLFGSTPNNSFSTLKTTNGNLHIDSDNGHTIYLNYYSGGGTSVIIGNGNGGSSNTIFSANGNVGVGADLTVSGGDIILSGTGRIQGVDTVSAGTDAANKTYVDNAVAGVPQGDITAVTAGTFLTGGGTSGDVTLNADASKLAHIHDSSNGTAAAGWITVAQASGARKAGEIYVTDGESSDHSYIRIEWMRSYADSNFTVLNCGGHANRIQGVRVLEETADKTYGKKYIQVKVTASSNYYVIVTAPGTIPNYGDFTAETPVLENSKTGYNIKGNTLEDLQNSSVGSEQGITSGGNIELNDDRVVFTRGDILSLSAGGATTGTEIVLDDGASVIKLNSDTIARDEFRVSSSTDGTGDDVFIANSGNGTFTLGDIEGLGSEAFIQGDASSIKIRNSSADSLVADSNNNVSIPNGNLIISEQIGVNTTNFNPQAGIIVNGNQTFGTPGGGSNVNARYLSIEGGADSGGEGSGRIFFSEHNSTTTDMDDYGMSLGYRGGPTSIVGASGQTWGGLSQIGNGEWGMWGHNNSASGALIMHGDRAATYVDFSGNNIQGITDAYIADQIIHTGDTNTYMQFHAADQWRVVTGGSERLEVNNSATKVNSGNFIVNQKIAIGHSSPGAELDIVAGTNAAGFKVVGNSTSYTAGFIANTGSGNAGIYYDASNGDFSGSDYGFIGHNNSGYMEYNIGSSSSLPYHVFTGGNVGIGTTSPNLKLDVISGTNNGIRISATDTTSNWRDIDIRSYVSQAQANALPDGSAIYTTNPTSQTETAFSKFGGLVLQGRDDGNSSFAIRLGNGNGYATRMFMGATGATVFSNTVTATNFILSSDERLKENVKKVCDNRVKADWKTFELKTDKGQKRYGVIAQELEKTNPEFVREDSEGFKSVAYIDLLIAKIAELETRIQKLEK